MKTTTKSSEGTSFYGTEFSATVKEMKKVLGPPKYDWNTGRGKVNMKWEFETKSGNVFTLYDYDEYRILRGTHRIDWHIGAHSAAISLEALEELRDLFSNWLES